MLETNFTEDSLIYLYASLNSASYHKSLTSPEYTFPLVVLSLEIQSKNTFYLCRLSFALSASKIKEKARVVAMDLRGHGKSSTENDLDLSIETMCNDVFAVLKALYGDSPPAIVLVGHSMGGSVAVHIAAKKTLRSLAGLVVVDVVEGTAMASLVHMQKILSGRMQHFSSIEKAIPEFDAGTMMGRIKGAIKISQINAAI
ncbi:hypothetical protein Goarm_009523 [Gossypium armourianum]|uniref:protein phosphatase methylesterase-1 n=1 Tax=Gossypium armourianum TaxID=34283 RepID=A0A7J9JTA4_9ROSI|nr:hypothetical protein [Gossypium armourianum]